MSKILTKQFLVTPATGKRMIAKSMVFLPAIDEALNNKKTIVIVAGTTNGYVAEEILCKINQSEGFSRKRFFRGIALPPNYTTTEEGRIADENEFLGDVVIVNGKWEKGKTIFDVADNLKKGDVIIKGANALDLQNRQAGIYIGHPKAGTISVVLQAVFGRRVQLYLPVGLEKRIAGSINEIAKKLNQIDVFGPRLMPVNGSIITELDAVESVSGAKAELVAAGGVYGAEGSCWIAVSGVYEQVEKAETFIKSSYSQIEMNLIDSNN